MWAQSVNESRRKSNLDVYNFKLDKEEMTSLGKYYHKNKTSELDPSWDPDMVGSSGIKLREKQSLTYKFLGFFRRKIIFFKPNLKK